MSLTEPQLIRSLTESVAGALDGQDLVEVVAGDDYRAEQNESTSSHPL